MKNRTFLSSTIGFAAALTLCVCRAQAQTNSAGITTITGGSVNTVLSNSIPNFFNQTGNWLTAFDTNKTWVGITGQFEDGLNQTTGMGAADYIRGQVNFGRWNGTVEGDFLGVGSAFSAAEAGGGFALLQKHDFKAELNALAGGTKVEGITGMRFKAEGELKISKLMTANTYATASLGIPYVQGKVFDGTPDFRLAMGFTW